MPNNNKKPKKDQRPNIKVDKEVKQTLTEFTIGNETYNSTLIRILMEYQTLKEERQTLVDAIRVLGSTSEPGILEFDVGEYHFTVTKQG